MRNKEEFNSAFHIRRRPFRPVFPFLQPTEGGHSSVAWTRRSPVREFMKVL